MKSHQTRLAVTILALLCPAISSADITASVILKAGESLDLDTGAVGPGGDIVWDGSTITPQGGARVGSLGNLGITGFAVAGAVLFSAEANTARTNPIAANLLIPGNAFVVVTSGGKTGGGLVTANSGGTLSLRFVTFGVTSPAGAPLVTDVFNNSSHISPGLPNYGVAPSSLFIVTGLNLADTGDPVLQSSASPGIPQTLNGASVTVTVNGVTTNPALYYTSPKQVAAVLPASTPVGNGVITLTYRGKTSPPAPIKVVAAAVGINTYNGDLGVVTDAVTGALLTYTNSGTPGQPITLWTTGLGANPQDSDTTFSATPHAVNTLLQVFIGGQETAILYQGSAGYPGVNQINVTIPSSVAGGCWISLVVVASGVVSNLVTIPIHAGGGACVDSQSGLNGNQISPSGGQTLRTGLISLLKVNSTDRNGNPTVENSANGAFVRYTGLYAPPYALSSGACLVNPATSPVPGVTFLRAGALTMMGPGGTVNLGNPLGISGQFFNNLTAAAFPATGGTFTFNGAAGPDVGAYTTTLTLANPLFSWTNQAAASSIDRSRGFTVTWTGGNAGSDIYISGSSKSTDGVVGRFECLATADARQFTIPSYVLLAIPPGPGGIAVQNSINAPLTATGLDIATATAAISYSGNAAFQ